MNKFADLLNDGEYAEKLEIDGWIVLSNQLKSGDEIIIDKGTKYNLFDRPVRAIVDSVVSNNLIRASIITPGAKDSSGSEWPVGVVTNCLDVMYRVYKIRHEQRSILPVPS